MKIELEAQLTHFPSGRSDTDVFMWRDSEVMIVSHDSDRTDFVSEANARISLNFRAQCIRRMFGDHEIVVRDGVRVLDLRDTVEPTKFNFAFT